MKRFLKVASVLVLIFIAVNVWATLAYLNGHQTVVKRAATGTAETDTNVSIYLPPGDWNSMVGSIFVSNASESTGVSARESTIVRVRTIKGGLTYTVDSFADVDSFPDTFHVVRLGNDTLYGEKTFIQLLLNDSSNSVVQPITWQINYKLKVK